MEEAGQKAAAAEAEQERLRGELEVLRAMRAEQEADRHRLEELVAEGELRVQVRASKRAGEREGEGGRRGREGGREEVVEMNWRKREGASESIVMCGQLTWGIGRNMAARAQQGRGDPPYNLSDADQAADYRKTLRIPPISLPIRPADKPQPPSQPSSADAAAPLSPSPQAPAPRTTGASPPHASPALHPLPGTGEPGDSPGRAMNAGHAAAGRQGEVVADGRVRAAADGTAAREVEVNDEEEEEEEEIFPEAAARAESSAASTTTTTPRPHLQRAQDTSFSTPPPRITAPGEGDVTRSVARDAYSQRSSPSPPAAASPPAGSPPRGGGGMGAGGGGGAVWLELLLDARYQDISSDSLRFKQALEQVG
jgi:hypothetical protein